MSDREIEAERARLIGWLAEHQLPVGSQIDREMTADALMADFIAPRMTELAALRAQDREDGAREMRERAAKAADDWLTIWGTREIRHTSAREYAGGAVADVLDAIRALPLSPARKEDGDA